MVKEYNSLKRVDFGFDYSGGSPITQTNALPAASAPHGTVDACIGPVGRSYSAIVEHVRRTTRVAARLYARGHLETGGHLVKWLRSTTPLGGSRVRNLVLPKPTT